jgi:phage FluMu gp28-like protein
MKNYTYKKKSRAVRSSSGSAAAASSARLELRPYQREAFKDRSTGIEVWLWARQTGKSYALAAWAVDRLLTRPGRLVTVLSNSKTNGMEFNLRCAEVCKKMGQAFEQENLSSDKRFESMNCETRIRVRGRVGRIKILAANPRTARGFSGDLILDEFAFQENATAIWDAVEPILASNKDFLCRIASTPNGKGNLFYQLCNQQFAPIRRVTRTDAYRAGCPIHHPVTRESIDPETARKLALNKSSYDQNYECVFSDENTSLLTHELISAAERAGVGVICEGEWSSEAIALLKAPVPSAPGRKTARQWVDEADDPDAILRRISWNVCGGNADRFRPGMEFGL